LLSGSGPRASGIGVRHATGPQPGSARADRHLLTVDFRQPSHEFTFNVGIDLLF
jgi:hypothetical protein